MERLCFGTFINVLACCIREGTTKTQLTGTIIKTIDPESKYMNEDVLKKNGNLYSNLSHLYTCRGNFSIDYSQIVELAPTIKRKIIIQKFENTVIPLIDKDKCSQAILALCDIIRKDTTLDYKNNGDNVKKFQDYIGKDIEDLLKDNEFVLSEFLANIFRYTVTEIKNTAGKEWIESISQEYKENGKKYKDYFEDYVNRFKDKQDTIQVWNTVKQRKESTLQNITKKASNDQMANKEQPTSMLDEFYNSFEGQGIGAFIDSNPIDSLKSFRITDAIDFFTHIKYKHENEDSPDKNEEIYKDIIEFINTLEKYIDFLIINSSDSISYTNRNFSTPPKYDSPNCNSDEFKSKTDHYRCQLNTLYQNIKTEYERKQNEYREKLRDTNRHAFNNANAGSLHNAVINSINSNQH